MKKCAKCGKVKPLSEFYKTSRENGYTARCKECHGVETRICVVCGKEFSGKRNKKLCSIECKKIYRPQTFLVCKQCGKTFGPVDRLDVKYCSMECKALSQKGTPSNKKGRHYPHLQRARVAYCPVCNKRFRAVADFGDRKQIHCSHRCYLKNRRVSHYEERVGEYLKNKGIPLSCQFKVKKWSFDFKIEGLKILIEADGSYWHSLLLAVARDKKKDAWCKMNGYELYRIDEIEFKKDKEKACDVTVKRWENFTGGKAELIK